MMQWWAEQQTAYHRLHDAVSLALEEMEASQKLADSRSAADFCPKCGRRIDFWPEEVDRPEDARTTTILKSTVFPARIVVAWSEPE